MPTPILKIPVDDERFKEFLKLYEKYQEQLKKLPVAWAETEQHAANTAEQFGTMTAALLAQQEILAQRDTSNEKNARTVEQTGRGMDKVRQATKDTARYIADATKSLLTWSTVMTAVSGLLGAGGLWGIDRLALAAVAQNRSATGLGTTSNNQQALDINFKQLFDTNSALGNVAGSRSDLSRRWAFNALGISADQLKDEDNADLTADLAIRAKEIYGRSDKTEQSAQALGLTQFFTMEDLRRLDKASMEELQAARKQMKDDEKSLKVDPQIQKEWGVLTRQLNRAGTEIETALIRNLVRLAPGIEKLSDEITTAIVGFLDSPAAAAGLKWFGDEINDLAKYLQSDDFKKQLNEVEDDLTQFGKAVMTVVKAINDAADYYFGTDPSKTKQEHEQWNKDHPFLAPFNPRNFSTFGEHGEGSSLPQGEQGFGVGEKLKHWWNGDATKTAYEQGAYNDQPFGSDEARNNLPPGLLKAVRHVESADGTRLISSAGAQGDFQFMPATWSQYGNGGSPFDTKAAASAAGRYYGKLFQQFGGDEDKALAAYNWGEGHLADAIKKYGDRWREHAPKETQDYITKVEQAQGDNAFRFANRGGQSGGQVVRIDVNNNTGGAATITASQLAT